MVKVQYLKSSELLEIQLLNMRYASQLLTNSSLNGQFSLINPKINQQSYNYNLLLIFVRFSMRKDTCFFNNDFSG